MSQAHQKTFLEQIQRGRPIRRQELIKIADDRLMQEELTLVLIDRVNDFNARLCGLEDRAYRSDKLGEIALRIEYGA